MQKLNKSRMLMRRFLCKLVKDGQKGDGWMS